MLSLYHLVLVRTIFQLESPSLRVAAVLKHLLCCSSLTRLRGGGGWNPRCTKQLSWKQIIVIWAASILDKDDNTTNVVQRNNQFKVAKIDLANLSYYCFGGLQFLRLRDAWSLLWHFHHWSGHQFMASTSATEWIPSISNLCKAMIVLTI